MRRRGAARTDRDLPTPAAPGYSRRRFLGTLGCAAGSALVSTWPRSARAQSPSRVASVIHGAAWTGAGWTDGDLDAAAVRTQLALALQLATTTPDLRSALQTLFPALTDAGQRYGIKVNCVNPLLPTHPTLVRALTDLLVEHGATANRIIVFDRSDAELARCGYALHTGEGVQVYGTDRAGVGYSPASHKLSDGGVRLSRIVAEQVDVLINIAVLKNHTMAGATLTLKNHFGSLDRPEYLHGVDLDCSPGVAELNALPLLRERGRLFLIDALFGTFVSGLNGRPDFAPMTLLAGTDPVAVDTVGVEMINEARSAAGLLPTTVPYLAEAETLGLGQTAVEPVKRQLSPAPTKPKPWRAEAADGCRSTPDNGAALLAAGATLSATLPARRRRES